MESRFGITEEQYNQGKSERVMPAEVELSTDYICRMRLPTRQVSPQVPYAIELLGTVAEIKYEPGEAWEQVVHLALEMNSTEGIVLPMNLDGFVVIPRPDFVGSEGNSARFIQIGYLLGHTSLSDFDLAQIVKIPLLV